MTLHAMANGKSIGYIDYRVYHDEVNIQYITVRKEWRRQGVARALMKELEREYGYENIETGMATEEGTKLLNQLNKERGYTKKTKEEKEEEQYQKEISDFVASLEKYPPHVAYLIKAIVKYGYTKGWVLAMDKYSDLIDRKGPDLNDVCSELQDINREHYRALF